MERKAVGSRDTEDSMRMIEDDDPGDGLRDNLDEFIDFSLATACGLEPSDAAGGSQGAWCKAKVSLSSRKLTSI